MINKRRWTAARRTPFSKEQRGGALNIVNGAAAFGDDFGQGFKIGFEQYQLGYVAGCVGAPGNGNAAVGLFESHHIIDAVAGHGHCVAFLLQSFHQQFFLLWGHAAEYGVFFCGFGNLLFDTWDISTALSQFSTPARQAMPETVSTLSPEITLQTTPCSLK